MPRQPTTTGHQGRQTLFVSAFRLIYGQVQLGAFIDTATVTRAPASAAVGVRD
jgi:hypothetical protein